MIDRSEYQGNLGAVSVDLLHLPEVGIHGNTHFPFSDLNNEEVADLMSKFLSEKELD